MPSPTERSEGFNTDAAIVCAGVGNFAGQVFGSVYGGTAGGAVGSVGMLFGPAVGVPTTLLGVAAGKRYGESLGGIVLGGTATYLCGRFVPEEGWWW